MFDRTREEQWILLSLLVAVVVALLLVTWLSTSPGPDVMAIWVAGAAALGLLSGFTTGASEQKGTAAEFLKFLSGGILVPILGGIAALLQQSKRTVEASTYTAGQVTEKVTEVTLPSQEALFHPLWVLGSFFLAYGVFAVLGIVLGIRRRKKEKGIPLKN